KLTLSYLKDWVLVAVLTVGFFLIDKISPFHRDFSLQNKSISFPYKTKETIPIWLGVIFALVVPLVIIVFIAIVIRRSPYDCHNALLGLCLSFSLALMFTDALKITVGRHRPDFLSRCQVRYEDGNPPQDPPLGLTTTAICTQTDEFIFNDGLKSFPSAHTSLGFAGLGFLSLYLAGKLHLFDGRGHTYKSFLVVLPVVGALLIGISRICDYRHHWSDVFTGAIIGIVTACFSYRQYFPSLGITRCDKPFSPRIPR
ncbi:PAP2-domain-containing protein, partial [Basidiobolus meristosporus CBS 931.73]